MPKLIKEFQGPNRWLSNFAPCTIIIGTRSFSSVEHAYMSFKSLDASWRDLCASNKHTPGQIKRLSRTVTLRPDWDSAKIPCMRLCLWKKFTQEPYKTFLINTKDAIIQEGNNWNDTFWGINLKTGKGSNTLGKLIMDIREILINNKEHYIQI